jgi:hypothetical protein
LAQLPPVMYWMVTKSIRENIEGRAL